MRNLERLDLVRGPDIKADDDIFGVIGTVADRKHIADRQADEVDRRSWGRIGDRSPGIHDVVDEQYRSS